MSVDGHLLPHCSTHQPVIVAVLPGANVSNHQSRVALHAPSLLAGHASCFTAAWLFLLRSFGALSVNSSELGTEEIQQHVRSVVSKRWYVAG